jgi:hypothetical protein
MTDIAPLYDVHVLRFNTAAFAITATSNAVWITGEWLALRPKPDENFSPEPNYRFDPRYWQEALLTLDKLPQYFRHRIFAKSFMRLGHGGEDIFRRLAAQHPEMLHDALRREWLRRHVGKIIRYDVPTPDLATVANELLPRLTGPR